MISVLDASATVMLLVDSGPLGQWVGRRLVGYEPVSTHLMPSEVAGSLRRREAAGAISTEAANLAAHELGRLHFDLYPYVPFADRIWELRRSLSPYDAWYVAVAEALDAPLVTLDRRLSRAPGPMCEFLVPED